MMTPELYCKKPSRVLAILGVIVLLSGLIIPLGLLGKLAGAGVFMILAIPVGAVLSLISAMADRSRFSLFILIALAVFAAGLLLCIVTNLHMLRSGQPAGGDLDMKPSSRVFIAIIVVGWALCTLGSLLRLGELWQRPPESGGCQ